MVDNNGGLIPESDRDFLVEKEYTFQLIPEQGSVHLILQNIPFSEKFNPRFADILIMIPVGYPTAPLDMFWTFPEITLANGAAPETTEMRQEFHGKNWQRWSRHGAWRPGVDNLRTFIKAMRKEIDGI